MIERSGWPKNMRIRWIRIRNTACRIWGRTNALVVSSPCLNLPLLAAHKAGEVLPCVGNGGHLVATCQQVHEFQLVQPQFWDTQALSSRRKFSHGLWCGSGIFKARDLDMTFIKGTNHVRTENFEIILPLKGQCHEIFCFWFFSWISFPPRPRV